ncbi:hypothetical protein [Parapedobacter tibetensis]|uniref:hypothetical protein n=1 Tax=Parapedobacter tibetensis TaxID=2972951 RepID=UPI00214D238B|nr:hypothetical protein [Parapedobacter tibetensis]
MEEKLESISVFWRSDKKEVEKWAEAVCNFLFLLKEHNSTLFGKWYKKGRSKKEAMKFEIPLDKSFFHSEIVKKGDKLFDNLVQGFRIGQDI